MSDFSDLKTILTLIKKLYDDPLGIIFVCEFRTRIGTVRWNCGTVQTKLTSKKNYVLPIPAKEFLEEYGYKLD